MDPFALARGEAPKTPQGAIASDPFAAARDPAAAYLDHAATYQSSWEDVAERLRLSGYDPEEARQPYLMDREKRRVASADEPNWLYFTRRSIPGASAGFEFMLGREVIQARERMDKGEASEKDIGLIAEYERLKEIEEQRTTGESIKASLAHIPAILGEAYATGGIATLARGGAARLLAGQTAKQGAVQGAKAGARVSAPAFVAGQAAQAPAMPSLYAHQAVANAERSGGNPEDFTNLVPAVAYAMALNTVLGRTQQPGTLAASVPTVPGRVVAKTGAAIGEQQLVDVGATALDKTVKAVTDKSMNLDMGYGTAGTFLTSDQDTAWKHAATQAVTFGVFSAMHAGPAPARKKGQKPAVPASEQLLIKFAESAKKMKAAGVESDLAASRLAEVGNTFEAEAKADPAFDRSKAELVAENVTRRLGPEVKDYAAEVAKAYPKRPTPEAPTVATRDKPAEVDPLRPNADLDAAFAEPAEPRAAPERPAADMRAAAELDAAFGVESNVSSGKITPRADPSGEPGVDAPLRPEDFPSRFVSVPEGRKPVGLRLANERALAEERYPDPAERKVLADLGENKGLATKFDMTDASGNVVGSAVLVPKENGVIDIPWASATGKAGGEGRGRNQPFTPRDMIELGKQIAVMAPDAKKLTWIPSEGRIRPGERRTMDLDRVRDKYGLRPSEKPTPPRETAPAAPQPRSAPQPAPEPSGKPIVESGASQVAKPAPEPARESIESLAASLEAGRPIRERALDALVDRGDVLEAVMADARLTEREKLVVGLTNAGWSLRELAAHPSVGKSHETVRADLENGLAKLGLTEADARRVQSREAEVEKAALGELSERSLEELAQSPGVADSVRRKVRNIDPELAEIERLEREAAKLLKGNIRGEDISREDLDRIQGRVGPPADRGPPQAGKPGGSQGAAPAPAGDGPEARAPGGPTHRGGRKRPSGAAPEPGKAARLDPTVGTRKAAQKPRTVASHVGGAWALDPTGHDFLTHFGSAKEALGEKVGFRPGAFKKGGRTLSEVADEMHNEGVINDPNPATRVQTLVDLIRSKKASVQDTRAADEARYEESARRQEEERVERGEPTRTDEEAARMAAEIEAELRAEAPPPEQARHLAGEALQNARGEPNLADLKRMASQAEAVLADPKLPRAGEPGGLEAREPVAAYVEAVRQLTSYARQMADSPSVERAVADSFESLILAEVPGLKRVGAEGETSTFDHRLHGDAPDGKSNIPQGAKVRVVRPGWSLELGGRTDTLVKAIVEPLTPTVATSSPVQRNLLGEAQPKRFGSNKGTQLGFDEAVREAWTQRAREFAEENGLTIDAWDAGGRFRSGGDWYEVGRAEDGYPVRSVTEEVAPTAEANASAAERARLEETLDRFRRERQAAWEELNRAFPSFARTGKEPQFGQGFRDRKAAVDELDARIAELEGQLGGPAGDAPFGLLVPPQLAGVMNAIGRAVFGRPRGADPAWTPDADPNPHNPRALPAYDVIKDAAANQVFSRNATEHEKALTARAFSGVAGQSLADAWHLQHTNLDPAFRGTLIEDVVRAELASPGGQQLTPEQKAAIAVWKDVKKKQLTALHAEGAKFYDANGKRRTLAEMLADDYFPRTVAPESVGLVDALFGRTGGESLKPGTRQSYREARTHQTEAAGVAAGVKYLDSFSERVADFIAKTNREIADLRLANDPALGGKDVVLPTYLDLLKRNKPFMADMTAAQKRDFRRELMRQARMQATGNVHVAPAFRTKVYPEASKRAIEAQYGERGGVGLKAAQGVSQEVRNLVLGADVSYTTLQLLPTAFTNPKAFAKAVRAGFESFFRPDVHERIAQTDPQYAQAIGEMAQSGAKVGTAPENMGDLLKNRTLLSRVPVLGAIQRQTYGRATRAFSTAMDVAKVYEWMSNRPANPAEWFRAAEAIENTLGQGRMEQVGMTPERALGERIFLLAPSYYRGYVAALHQAFQGGAAGRVARKKIAGLAAGVLTVSLAALYAKRETGQLSDEEFEERVDPSNGKFLMVPVELGSSGKRAEVGFGGFYLSMVRTLANMTREDSSVTGSAGRWYRGHSGVLPRLAWDVTSGQDYMGNPVTPTEAVAKGVLPLAVQQSQFGEGTPGQRAASAGFGMLGLRSHPESEDAVEAEAFRRTARQKYGRPFGELSLQQQSAVVKQVGRERGPKPKASAAARLRGAENADRRQKSLEARLDPATRRRIEAAGAAVPGYDYEMSVNGAEVPLGSRRAKRYEELLAEEYDREVGRWNEGYLSRTNPTVRDRFVEASFRRAKLRARNRLLRESRQPVG